MSTDPPAPQRGVVFFDRQELAQLLRLYGRMVVAGEWRDYAIDGLADAAVFSVFRHSAESPAYSIEKRPALARRQGAWAVQGRGGVVLRRGAELAHVLRVFEARKFQVIE